MKQSIRNFVAAAFIITTLSIGTGHTHHYGEGNLGINQPFPGPLSMANFGKVIGGEFTGDLKRDLVVMDGSRPKLCVAPETYDTAITVRPQVNDIATQSGIVEFKDVILTVSDAGLVRYERDSENAVWIESILRGVGTDWIGAKKVAVCKLNSDAIGDIVGIGANGRDVLIEYGNSEGTYTPGTTFTAYGSVVQRIVALNWRNTGGVGGIDEIALFSPEGVELRDVNGTFLEGLNATNANILGVAIDGYQTDIQRLALVLPYQGYDKLYVYGDTQTDTFGTLGPLGSTVAFAAADMDEDGDSELFVTNNINLKVKYFANRQPLAAPTFQMSSGVEISFGPPDRDASLNHSDFVAGDFDSDGKLDLALPAQGTLVAPIESYGTLDIVNVEVPNVQEWRADVVQLLFDPAENQLRFKFSRPQTVLTPGSGQVVKLGIKTFLRPEVGLGTQPIPFREAFIDLPDVDEFETYFMDLDPEFPDFDLATSPILLSMVVRQTVLDTNDAVVDIAPAMMAIFTPGPSVDLVSTSPHVQYFWPTWWYPESTPTDGGVNVGPPVPGLDEDEEPRDPDPRG